MGQSLTFDFGTIDLEEPDAHGGIVPGELDDLGIIANLTFTAPTGLTQTLTTTSVATSGVVSEFPTNPVDYVIDWSPGTVPFGSGGSFQVSLADMNFSNRRAQFQTASVTS